MFLVVATGLRRTIVWALGHSVRPRPLPSSLNGCRLVFLPTLGNVICERIIWVRSSKQSLDRKEDSADLQSR